MTGPCVVLTGGVGGAKLVRGLASVVPSGRLAAIVNTGDDFSHFGLPISPDVDTLLYTLAGKADRKLGWGREGETWSFMEAAQSLGAPGWFSLGDGDLALHVLRRAHLESGGTLSDFVANVASAWEIAVEILPMSDGPIRTMLDTDEGRLPFQTYFVARRCEPKVSAIQFDGAHAAVPAPRVIECLRTADAILIAPSNPWLSIDPILAVPGIAAALRGRQAPAIAISPLVRGQAVKGPTAKLMQELGLRVDNEAIADHYSGLVDGMIVHHGDPAPRGLALAETDTLMPALEDSVRVAEVALSLAATLG